MDEEASKPVFTGPKFNMPTKKYGLIIPGKATGKTNNNQKKVVKPCIFDEDDDDEVADTSSKTTKFSQNTSANRLKKQTQIDIEKALTVDPNIFEYDNIYDEMEKEKNKIDPKKNKKDESREPKYIAGIMKAAAKRQMEFEKLQERKIHKERKEEGDLWKDKEVFVTSAYRKKMEERQKIEEEERNQERIEELLDVRKQKDLSGFYSNLLKMKSGEMVIEEEGAKEKRLEMEKEGLIIKQRAEDRTKKTYRSKQESSDEEEEEEVKQTNTDNIDEDDRVDENTEEINDKNEAVVKEELDEPSAKKLKQDSEVESTEVKEEKTEIKEEPEEKKVEPKLTKEQKRALLFDKRTVGTKFDEELAEYFHRKSSILSLKSYIEREN